MCNLKFSFLLRDQQESQGLYNFFLIVFKMLPCSEVFVVTLFLKHSTETVLIIQQSPLPNATCDSFQCIGTLDWIRSEGHTGVIR